MDRRTKMTRFTRELGQTILGHAFAKIIRKLVLTLPWQMSNLDLAPIKCTQNAVVKARTDRPCLATADSLCILIALKNFPPRFTFQLLSLGLVPKRNPFPAQIYIFLLFFISAYKYNIDQRTPFSNKSKNVTNLRRSKITDRPQRSEYNKNNLSMVTPRELIESLRTNEYPTGRNSA